MTIIEGYLTEVDSKTGQNRSGRPYTVYRGEIAGTWYSFGFEKPPVSRGDYVRAEIGQVKGYDQVVRSERLTAPSTAQPALASMQQGLAAAAENSPSSPGGTHYSRSRDPKQTSIHYQNSRNCALDLIALLISQDALPISATKSPAGKAKRYEEIMALVDKITVQYFYDAETLRNLDRVQDAGAEGKDVTALPEDAQTEEAAIGIPSSDWS